MFVLFTVAIIAVSGISACAQTGAGEVANSVISVTYPNGKIDTFRPRAAYIAPKHEAVQAVIKGDDFKWDSGIVERPDGGRFLDCPLLKPGGKYFIRIRIRQEGNWKPWSAASEFETPSSPVVKILSPRNAESAIGPRVAVNWSVEAHANTSEVELIINGRSVLKNKRPNGTGKYRALMKPGVNSVRVVASSGGRATVATSSFHVWNSPQPVDELLVLDLSEMASWKVGENKLLAYRMYDIMHAASCLQGILNRERPQMFIRAIESDEKWLEFLRSEGAWLSRKKLVTISIPGKPEEAIRKAVEMHKDAVRGVVIWDGDVAATSNVATTAAGVENLLPVRADSRQASAVEFLKQMFPVIVDLRGKFTGKGIIPDTTIESTGSAKNDAYIWAKTKYLDSGKTDPKILGYWIDSFWLTNPGRIGWWEHCLLNHDWIVSKRGFVFDLHCWGDEAPQDDLNQKPGTDLETFKTIMLSAYKRSRGEMIHMSGFTPWAFKYTQEAEPKGKHEPVSTEWELIRIVSAYNAYLDADAIGYSSMANASLWHLMPMPGRYNQNPPPTRTDLQKQGFLDAEGNIAPLGYVLYYMGDYDSAVWLSRMTYGFWADEARGRIPIGWAFNPNLSERAAPVFHYVFQNKSPLDSFIAGDSGAGYVNPTMLMEPRKISELPSAEDVWVKHNLKYYNRFGYSITGFLINGHAGTLNEPEIKMTARFSTDGAASQGWKRGENNLVDTMPFARQQSDLAGSVEDKVKRINGFRNPGTVQFLNFRVILVSPSHLEDISKTIASKHPEGNYAFVGPFEWYWLMRHQLGGSNERLPLITFDNLPTAVAAGTTQKVSIGFRNDGWDTWQTGKVVLEASVDTGGKTVVSRTRLTTDVEPGQGHIFTLPMKMPEKPGNSTVSVKLIINGHESLRPLGRIDKRPVIIEDKNVRYR